jgi:alpha-L-rhamnosidase
MKTAMPRMTVLLPCLVALQFGATLPAADINEIQRRFEQPPDDARMMVRWWWFGPAVTKAGLEAEMKRMKEGGIGGFEVQPTYPLALDDEKAAIKNLKFLSPEFLEMLGFTAQQARELGLRMDLTLGSGWPYGGPQFSASEAAGRLRTTTTPIKAGQKSVPLPASRGGQKVFAAFIGPLKNAQVGENPFKEVPISDNAAQLPADLGGATQLTFFIAGQTGMQVKRPAYGAEGNVIDHYNPAVVAKFIKEIAEPEVRACGANPPYAIFCDSLESGGEDWTSNFLDEFQKRRGYDLRPYLPALFNNIGPKTAEIRHDWGKTITEIFNDYFVRDLAKWAKANGTRFRIQAYGTPPATLTSYASADLPEGEGHIWNAFQETRWASSASHLLGRPITSSETWTWLHSPVFRATPLDMKAEADLHVLQGVNQFIGHGWPYTPPGVAFPGWRFYASAVFDDKNPWWLVMPDVTKYLQRVCSAMREGQPANDVALYLANSDAWASFAPGRVAMNKEISTHLGREIVPLILAAGYNLDFFDDGLLELRGKVDGGALAFGDLKYKVVVLAGVERIPPSTLRKLEEFAKGGGILIATRRIPTLAPGLAATAEDQKSVQEIAQRLFKGPDAPGLFLESESGFAAALAQRLTPDVKFEHTGIGAGDDSLKSAKADIGFVHRKTDVADIYFVANTGNRPKRVKATFRVKDMQVERWDPVTGRITSQAAEPSADGTSVTLELEHYGSQIFVLTKRTLPSRKAAPTDAIPSLDLSGGWSVYFGKDAKPVVMEKLVSWTENKETRFFSGVATYVKKVTVPAEMLKEGIVPRLQFGPAKATAGDGTPRMQARIDAPVREAAVVFINGKRAGSAWCPPYEVDLTGMLTSGENEIRIEVANLAVNYMASSDSIRSPSYSALIERYGNRFQPQDIRFIQPVPAGLFGPIRVIAAEAK